MSAASLAVVGNVLEIRGDWRGARAIDWPTLPPQLDALDGAPLVAIDPNGVWLLLDGLAQRGLDVPPCVGWRESHRAVFDLVVQHRTAAPPPPQVSGALARLGRSTSETLGHVVGLIHFVGQCSVELLQLLRAPGGFRGREFAAQVRTIFVDAIPLAFAMLFLLGVVFAYLLGTQSRQYGANIFVVDGVAMAVLRELSPVIVAILVAGRTGAAITAELGTMKVTEEIDAIATLGLSPFNVLVLPRLLALMLALPLLVFVGDIAGLLGGALIVVTQLDLSGAMFVERLTQFVDLDMLMIGLSKAPVFALFIGLIACRMGLSVAREAQSVGRHTTSTVVQSIVAIIVLNALFAVIQVRSL